MNDSETPVNDIWSLIRQDTDELAHLHLRIRLQFQEQDFEDIKQIVIFQILRYSRKDKDLLKRFHNRATRRAFISTSLRYAAYAEKRSALRRKAQSLGDLPETFPLLDYTPHEQAESLARRLLQDTAPRSDARFVLEHYLLGVSIKEYALANGVSVRTAYRRFAKGLKQLQEKVAFPPNGA